MIDKEEKKDVDPILWMNHQREHKALEDRVVDKSVVRESDLRWGIHDRVHDQLVSELEVKTKTVKTALDAALVDHHREHEVHENAHRKEHEMTALAVYKAEVNMDKRLESMNEFRSQLNMQANTFTTRDTFDRYVKEHEEKFATGLSTSNERINSEIRAVVDRHDKDMKSMADSLVASEEKEEAVIRSVVNRHDADFNTLREQLQEEREIRKKFEGSVNTFKYLVGLFGLSGIAGILVLFNKGG